jgi:hypothetical protein
MVTEVMAAEGHCVPYYGGAKEDTIAHHQKNRERLLEEGVVNRDEYQAALNKGK